MVASICERVHRSNGDHTNGRVLLLLCVCVRARGVCFCARVRARGSRFGSRRLTRCELRAARESLATARARLRETLGPARHAPCDASTTSHSAHAASPGRASAFAPQGPVAAVCHGPVGRWHTDATCRPEGVNALARPRAPARRSECVCPTARTGPKERVRSPDRARSPDRGHRTELQFKRGPAQRTTNSVRCSSGKFALASVAITV